MVEHKNGSSMHSIARPLRRSSFPRSRELRRVGTDSYDATRAAEDDRSRRVRSRRSRLLASNRLPYQYAYDTLVFLRWPPQQIDFRIRNIPESVRPGRGKTETIYVTIYTQRRGALKREMVVALRQAKANRG